MALRHNANQPTNQPVPYDQGGSDGSGRHSAAPMLTAIMSGGVGISGRELSWSC